MAFPGDGPFSLCQTPVRFMPSAWKYRRLTRKPPPFLSAADTAEEFALGRYSAASDRQRCYLDTAWILIGESPLVEAGPAFNPRCSNSLCQPRIVSSFSGSAAATS
jgi:hypothetical protein